MVLPYSPDALETPGRAASAFLASLSTKGPEGRRATYGNENASGSDHPP